MFVIEYQVRKKKQTNKSMCMDTTYNRYVCVYFTWSHNQKQQNIVPVYCIHIHV